MPHCIFAWATLIFLFSAAPAWSWSAKGHHIVGAIADEVLKKNPTTKAKVKEILGGHTLATVSVWADCAKGFMYCQRTPSHEEQAYASKNPEHHNFHYADIPYQENGYVDASAGSAKYDVVHVISYAVAVLRGNAPANSDINLTNARPFGCLRTSSVTPINHFMWLRSTTTKIAVRSSIPMLSAWDNRISA